MEKTKPFFVLFLLFAIFLIFGVREVYRVRFLYSYDPFYHMNIAKNIDSRRPLAREIYTYDDNKIPITYPTILRLQTVLINQVTGVSYLNIYKLFGLFCRILTALTIYITVVYLVQSRTAAVLAVILFLSSRYIFYRALVTFPENLVLPFHVLVFRDVIRGIRQEKIPYTLPIFFSTSMLIHYRSIVIPIVLVAILIVHRIYHFTKEKKNLLSGLFSKALVRSVLLIIVFVILSLPMIGLTVSQYKEYRQANIGSEATWAPHTVGDPRYSPPSLRTYLNQMGALLFLLIMVFLFTFPYKPNVEKLVLLVWLIFTFVLTRGTQFKIYVPSDRMLVYFIVPSVVVSAYFLKILTGQHGRNRRSIICAFSFILILLLINGSSDVKGWQGVSEEEIETCSWINANLSSRNSVILFSDINLINGGIEDYKLLETRERTLDEVFVSNRIVTENLKSLYGDRLIYIVVRGTSKSPFTKEGLACKAVNKQGHVTVYRINP